MAVKFLSEEWEAKMKEKLEEVFVKKGNVTTTFCQQVLEAPDEQIHWMLLTLDKSIFKSYEVGVGEMPDAKFTATSPYKTFEKVIKGELDGSKALVNGEFQLEGNMVKALALIGTYNKLETIQRSIPTEFES